MCFAVLSNMASLYCLENQQLENWKSDYKLDGFLIQDEGIGEFLNGGEFLWESASGV